MDRKTSVFVLRACSTLGLGIRLVGWSATAAALPPCTDGSVFGNLTSFYQAVLGDQNRNGTIDPGETPSAYYGAMTPSMKDMVECGADPARTAPDIVLYRQRPESLGGVVRDGGGRVVARVYDHLDPVTERFYVAVVLSGCYTDNAFGRASAHPTDAAYLSSVFWPGDHTHASSVDGPRLRGSFRCEGAAGAAVYDVDLPTAPSFPAELAWRHGTSSRWNLEMREALTDPEVAAAMARSGVTYWDLADNSPPGGGAERPTGDDWKSPFDDPSNLFGELGWGTTWFSDRYLWEWQQVYELSFQADACSGTPDDWIVSWSADAASSPSKPRNEICGLDANQGTLTVIKDSIPDDPWDRYEFMVSGPTPRGFTLQDPGANECPEDPLCASVANTGAWTHPDRVTSLGLIASPDLGAAYRVRELAPKPGSSVGWECKNAATPLSAACDPAHNTFDFDACSPVAATCAAMGSDWADGHLSCRQTDDDFATCAASQAALETDPFELCRGMRAICRFTNQGDPGSDELCLETETAIGDLRVLGGAAAEVSFAAAAVPVSASGASDSIFLASFIPIADQSRWPGTIDHFIQPLPVIENDDGNLVPDRGRLCADAGETSCLAWDAAAEILEQAPDTTEVGSDRRIGTAPTDRRVTYTQAAVGDAVPRTVRAFDYSDSDAGADEHDLWQGMGIPFLAGDASSEEAARAITRHAIRRTLTERTVAVTDAGTGEIRPLTFVLGDVFHGDPVLVGGPSNFFYLANDVEGNGRACNATVRPNRGYRCFFERERRRRRVLLAPSNDGQIHAFDAGFFRGSVEDRRLVGRFDSGTGRELFAHIPRSMLVHTRNMVTLEHAPGIDGQLTVDDVFIDPAHSGTPTASDREWRTVAIGAYRDGGRGLYALDLTHPDPVQSRSVLDFAGRTDLEFVPVAASSAVPTCTALERSLPAGCGRPYPMALWEFADADLGLSWSKVNTGRVRVRLAGQTVPVARFVAVFGGGLDPADPMRGRHLYMVDVETGRTLWKRAVAGSVPSEPAAVDTDQDGFLDTLYAGTTAGYLYKVDVASPGDADASTGRVDDARQWAPFRLFDTGGREIFFRPTVIFDASTGRYAIGFGTGDRSDLWSQTLPARGGRFYLILDSGYVEGSPGIAAGPLTESSFQRIAAGSAASGGSFLTTPVNGNQPGWVLELGDDERVVTDALAVSGFLSFTTFDPDRPDLCSFGGSGHVYALLAANADAAAGGETERASAIEGLPGRATVTKAGFARRDPRAGADPFAAPGVDDIRASLGDLFPADCRFGAFSLHVTTSLSGREVVPLARIPVCVARKNWRELF